MSFISMRSTGTGDFECRDCKQLIRQIKDIKSPLNNRLVNARTNMKLGGRLGELHKCPNKQDKDNPRIGKIIKCYKCGKGYAGVFVDCPRCFKLQCQQCGHLRDWRYQYTIETHPNIRERNACPRCRSQYCDFVCITRLNEFGKYIRCEPYNMMDEFQQHYDPFAKGEIGWKPLVMPEPVPQIFDCERYGHIYKQGEERCRVCGELVISK